MDHSTQRKDELLEQIGVGWQALNATIDSLTVKEATEIKDAQGWSVKDHLFHLMAWEHSVVYFLKGEPRSVGLGVTEQLFLKGSTNEINTAIYKLGKDSSLYEVRVQYQIVHNRLIQQLLWLDDADLQEPYANFLANGSNDPRTVYQVVYSNTIEHYTGHLAWMKSLLGKRQEG